MDIVQIGFTFMFGKIYNVENGDEERLVWKF